MAVRAPEEPNRRSEPGANAHLLIRTGLHKVSIMKNGKRPASNRGPQKPLATIEKASASAPSLLSRITIDPQICHGKPAIRHLRYPVESILEYLAAGDSFEDLLAEFPDLERDDLRACLEFAALSLKLKSRHLVLP